MNKTMASPGSYQTNNATISTITEDDIGLKPILYVYRTNDSDRRRENNTP